MEEKGNYLCDPAKHHSNDFQAARYDFAGNLLAAASFFNLFGFIDPGDAHLHSPVKAALAFIFVVAEGPGRAKAHRFHP